MWRPWSRKPMHGTARSVTTSPSTIMRSWPSTPTMVILSTGHLLAWLGAGFTLLSGPGKHEVLRCCLDNCIDPGSSQSLIDIPYGPAVAVDQWHVDYANIRSEEHTSELQSLRHLVCR